MQMESLCGLILMYWFILINGKTLTGSVNTLRLVINNDDQKVHDKEPVTGEFQNNKQHLILSYYKNKKWNIKEENEQFIKKPTTT